MVQWLAKKGDQILYDKVEHNSFYDSNTKQAVPLDELKVDENYKVLWKSNKYNAKFIMKGKYFLFLNLNLILCFAMALYLF